MEVWSLDLVVLILHNTFLDECTWLGVRVITEFAGDPVPVIEKYRDNSAVMGWNPGDEPARRGITPEQMFARVWNFPISRETAVK